MLPALSRLLPTPILFVGLVFFPAAHWLSFEIDLLSVTFVLFTSWLLFKKKYSVAFSLVLLVVPLGLIFAPGQFALATLSLLPGIGTSLWRLRRDPSRLLSTTFFTSLGLALVFVLAFAGTLLGAIRYGLEQSSVNAEAYGIPWVASLIYSPQVNAIFFEFIRSGWIVIPAALLILTPWILKNPILLERALFLLTPIFFLLVTSLSRAATRIDPGFLSRLGQVSTITVAVLLPVILFFIFRVNSNPRSISIFLAPIALLGPLAGNSIVLGGLGEIVLGHISKSEVSEEEKRRAELTAVNFPAIGRAIMDDSQMQRLLETKSVLQHFEVNDREFLDLTERGATYSYLGLTPPIASGAVYNLASSGQQNRAVLSLESHPPKAILISADNIIHDGGPISTRTPILFEHLMKKLENYSLIDFRVSTWLVENESLLNHGLGAGRLLVGLESKSTLGDIWGLDDFRSLPAAWGGSISSLNSKITWGTPQSPDGNIQTASGLEFGVLELKPTTAHEISIRKKLVMLDIRASCPVENLTLRQFALGWQLAILDKTSNTQVAVFNVKEGSNLVPLYASRYWLSAKAPSLSNLAIDSRSAPCGPKSVKLVRAGVIKAP